MKVPQQTQPSVQLPSARFVWTFRLVLLGLFILWLAGGLYLQYRVDELSQRIERKKIEAARREEFLRRGAQYQQQLKEFEQRSRSRTLDGR